jgi:hypothetical protein
MGTNDRHGDLAFVAKEEAEAGTTARPLDKRKTARKPTPLAYPCSERGKIALSLSAG